MPSSLSVNQHGIVTICGCMVCFTINDVMLKQILRTFPAGETIFLRGIICSLLVAAAALMFGNAKQLSVPLSRPVATRAVYDGLSTAGFIVALAHMKLANIAAVLQISPLIITAISVVLYREVVGLRRWMAIALGFAGTLLVIKPIPSEFNVWTLAGVGAALAAAAREVQTRRIGRAVPVLTIAFWTTIGNALCGTFFLPTEDWRMIDGANLILLFGAAVFVGIAVYLLALGFRDVDLSVVVPFRYFYLLTSALGGFLIFGELPDGWAMVGAVLIMGSGLYTLHREAVHRRGLIGKATTVR